MYNIFFFQTFKLFTETYALTQRQLKQARDKNKTTKTHHRKKFHRTRLCYISDRDSESVITSNQKCIGK